MNPNPTFYDWLAQHYEAIYGDIDFNAIVTQWQGLLAELGVAPLRHDLQRTLLDVGCGRGEAMVAWARTGFAVYGLDSSRFMIDAALERTRRCLSPQHAVGFFHTDIRNPLTLPKRQFDLVVAQFNFVNLFHERELMLVMQNIACLLARRGVFVFDASQPPVDPVSTDRWHLPGGDITRTRVRVDDSAGVTEFVWSDGTTSMRECYWLHAPTTLQRLLEAAGLKLGGIRRWCPDEPSTPWQPFTADNPRFVMVAERL